MYRNHDVFNRLEEERVKPVMRGRVVSGSMSTVLFDHYTIRFTSSLFARGVRRETCFV